MRRIAAALGIAALAALPAATAHAATSNASATPAAHAAHVSPNATVLYKYFTTPDACAAAGWAGEQAGQWSYYYCQTIVPESWDTAGWYALYVTT